MSASGRVRGKPLPGGVDARHNDINLPRVGISTGQPTAASQASEDLSPIYETGGKGSDVARSGVRPSSQGGSQTAEQRSIVGGSMTPPMCRQARCQTLTRDQDSQGEQPGSMADRPRRIRDMPRKHPAICGNGTRECLNAGKVEFRNYSFPAFLRLDSFSWNGFKARSNISPGWMRSLCAQS